MQRIDHHLPRQQQKQLHDYKRPCNSDKNYEGFDFVFASLISNIADICVPIFYETAIYTRIQHLKTYSLFTNIEE